VVGGNASGGDSAGEASTGPVCVFVTAGGGTGSGTCGSGILSSGSTMIDGGRATTPVLDQDGNVIDAAVATVGAGISNLPPGNLFGAGPTGLTISDRSASSFAITGLQNGRNYNVVVAAVDGMGNVGPASQLVCDQPAPVNDFWTTYRQAGGRAGGGLFPLEAVGQPVQSAAGIAMVVGTGLMALRRRRKRRRSR
jgi:hypothetical protein